MRGLDLPQELESRSQWVCWRNECRECGAVLDPSVKVHTECDEKTTKRPINPQTGGFAKSDEPSTWASLQDAQEYHEGADTHGIGFMFSEDDQFVGVDLDGCRDPETGEIKDWALDIVETLGGFTEVSPSGTGLHIYVFGELDPDRGNRKDGVEIYDRGRYLTISGDSIPRSHSSIPYRQDEIEAIQSRYIEGSGYDGSGGSEIVDYELGSPEWGEDVSFENELGESLEEIRDSDEKLDALLSDLEAGYESASEADMAAVSKLWFWRFPRDTIAGILRTHRARPKIIERDDYLELTIGKAASGEQFDSRPEPAHEMEILEEREHYHSIDQADLPTDTNFVLDKPPREGGSHASIEHLSKRPLVILASRHAICEHHLDILDKVMPEGHTAVHYEGNNRACDFGGGESCPNYISGEDYTKLFDLEHEAKEVVHKQRIVTAEDAPDRFCKAQFVKHAEKYAESVVTVPHLLESLETDPKGKNLLIDEEQALGYFRPDSTELITVEQSFEADGTRQFRTPSSPISDQFDSLESIREDVFDEWNRRRKEAEERDGTWQKNSWEKDILNAITYLETVKDALGVSDTVQDLDPGFSYMDLLNELVDRADRITPPQPLTSPQDFREKLSDYTERYYYDDSQDPGELIEAALFRFDEKPFDFKKAGNAHKLRLVAGRQVFHQETLRSFEQIGVIAGPEGELLFKDLGMDAKTIKITDFTYSDDFVVVPLGRERKEGEMESPKTQRRRARNVSKILNARAHPHMAVAGTKERAKSHHSSLSSGTADIISSPESPAKDILSTFSVGGSAVIYENSAVSRGIDAPQFDISVVVSSGFATPHWEARRKYYRGEDADEYEYARNIEAQLKSHELTNAVLRPAPTRNVDDKTGSKFIVCSHWDAPRLRYLQDRILPKFGSAETAANFLQQLTIEGGYRAAIDEAYEYEGSERKFIEKAMETEFKETVYERPTYELEELELWKSQWHLPEGTVDQAKKAVPKTNSIPTGGAANLLDWNESKTFAAFTILERMGILESEKEYDKTKGKKKTLWFWPDEEGV